MSRHCFTIPSSHPCLPGHFPGNPVVPGVVILDEVLNAARQHSPNLVCSGFSSVKFLSPLLPNQTCEISFEPSKQGLAFQIHRQSDQALLTKGKLITFANTETSP